MNEQEFAQRLRKYRKDKGMTQQELADLLGVSNKTVSRWESYPDVTTLVALARALGVTVDELLDPKAPVRTLEKSDWQNLLSFAFVMGGGLLFYLLAQFVPLPLCWLLYLGCLAYGIYLQSHYTYHTRWFQLGVWGMVFFVSWSAVGQLLAGALPAFSKDDLPPLRLRRAQFHWTKALPALTPLVLMGYWCLFWRDDLPQKLYFSQQDIYVPLWGAVSVLTLLPLLKKGRRGLLIPAVLLALASRAFSGILVYPRAYDLINQKTVVDGTQGQLSGNHVYFGQANEDLMVAAVVLALLYLACCFLTIRIEPNKNNQRAESGEETGSF